MKRRVAFALLTFVSAAVAASYALVRSERGGTRLCAIAGHAVERATGLPLAVGACRLDPLRLALEADAIRLGPAGAPIAEVEHVRVRLGALQAIGGKLLIASAELRRPRVHVAPKGGPPRGGPPRCPADLAARVDVQALSIVGGELEVRLPSGGAVTASGVEARLEAASGVAGVRSRFDVQVARAAWRDGRREVAAAPVKVSGELAQDLSRAEIGAASAEGEGWSAAASGVVDDLCRPRLRIEGAAKAPLAMLLGLAGARADRVAGTAEARIALSGPATSLAASGDVQLVGARVGDFVPGDLRAKLALRGRELRVEALDVDGRLGGQVRARGTIRLDREPRLEAEADLRDVELAEVLERTGLPGAWVLLRASGKVKVAGKLSPLQLEGEGALDLTRFKALSHRWETLGPSEVPVLELAAARVESRLAIGARSVRLDGARLRAGADTLRAEAELFLDAARGFTVHVDGDADLSLLGHVASVPIGGRARLRGEVRAAPYGNPRIEGEARVAGLRFLDLDLGEAGAAFTYGPRADYVLRLAGIQGRKGETTYEGAAAVDLNRSPPEVLEGRLAARGRLRDLFDAVIPWLPRTRVVRDAVDGAVELVATASGPATALEADFDARLGAGTVLGRAYDAGRLEGHVAEGARALFRQAEIVRSGGAVRARGRWEFAPPNAWDLQASWAGLPLGDALAAPDVWGGRADGTATLAGSLEVPDVRFASTASGASVGGVPLRDARAEGRIAGEALTLEAAAEGVRLSATARAAGDGPFEARVELAHDDAGRLFRGDGGGAGARVQVRGAARAEGVLADVGAARADVRIDRLEASYADFRVANDAPVVLALAGRRLEVRPFLVRGTNTALTVAGGVAPGGALALDVTGTLDLRVVGDSVPRVQAPQGLLDVEARIGGTLSAPLLVGSGRLQRGGFAFKDVPIAFSGLAGDLSFSQSRVLFDRLDGAVNGGRTELAGSIDLEKLFPARLHVQGRLEEVPLRIPAWLPVTVSGALAVDGGWDAMALSGRLHVVRARYSENVDLEKSVLEFRRRAAVGTAYDPSGEWLRFDVALAVDGDCRVENDLVRGAVKGEVTLTGTLGAPGLLGTLVMAEGSRATFRGNDFALSHAIVDYTERRRIRMHLDVHGETRVREYQVFMHLYGPYDAPVLQLTSQPALTQEDLVALLSLGFTTRDAALTGTAGGAATAAAAQALFSVSGLDEQVRRFLPRAGPFRDFTVRMTSAYSEGTGQVEPRAELESKLLEDRLRLRWQAPISGARGQRAEAELKLGGRASVQYQWENDNPDVATGGDHGLDLKLRWEWND